MRALVDGIDRRFMAWATLWAVVSLLAFGLVSAIIPSPVFGRQIPPEPFAIVVWLASAPLMGVIWATYSVRPPAATSGAQPLTVSPMPVAPVPVPDERSTIIGSIAGVGAFLAIGCPVCNKIALVLLGTSGALTVYAPLQPVIGVASLVMLVATLGWRMRAWSQGATCPTPR